MGTYGGLTVFLLVFLSVWCLQIVPNWAQGEDSICDTKGCNCTDRASWTVVNCSFNAVQEVILNTNSIYPKIIEIFIIGGKLLVFKGKSFNSLQALSIIYIGGSQQVEIETQAIFNSSSPSLRLQIENCDRLIIRAEAFDNSEGSITSEISRTSYCSIEKAAYSKLLNASFQDIQHLDLVEGAFEINKKEGITRHGLSTKILFNNVNIPKIPPRTFFSSLAEIRFQNTYIQEIQHEAFSAGEISAIYMTNTTIGQFEREAFKPRTFILNFKISKCNISKLEAKAVMCAMSNLTIEHTRIGEIETSAINITAARIEFVGNHVGHLQASGLVFNTWNKINIDQNIIRTMGSNAISGFPTSELRAEFSFVGNEIHHLEESALNFVPVLEDTELTFDNNFFNKTCYCNISEWVDKLTNNSNSANKVISTSYCVVDELLSRCFELELGLINMQNFSSLICGLSEQIKCEHYVGETKMINTTTPILQEASKDNNSWLIFVLTGVGLLIIATAATLAFLLITGGRWLKRKGYFRNMHYNQNEHSNDDENTIVTMDDSDNKLEVPEELTLEYLEYLKKRLDNPETHQETSEMIERLYEMFIVEDSYENNNRQDEEAHLYEELANMQLPPGDQEPANTHSTNGPRSILRIMEEKFNLQFIDGEPENGRPPLVGDYSEPSDAAVHLYSELKQNQNMFENKSDPLNSTSIENIVFRPLPCKPNSDIHPEPGPSSPN